MAVEVAQSLRGQVAQLRRRRARRDRHRQRRPRAQALEVAEAGGARQHVQQLDMAGRALRLRVGLGQLAGERLREAGDVCRMQRHGFTGHDGLSLRMRQPRFRGAGGCRLPARRTRT